MQNNNQSYEMGEPQTTTTTTPSAGGDDGFAGRTQGGNNNNAGLNRFREAAQGNYQAAQQKALERAAQEKEAALQAQARTKELAQENYDMAKKTGQQMNDVRNEAMLMGEDPDGGRGLPAAALGQAATNNQARIEGQFAANKAMLAKNREALSQAQGEAKARMDEMQGLGRQALDTAAAATIDMARGEFEARCARVAEEEGRLSQMTAELEKREKQLNMLRNKGQPNWPCQCCCFHYLVHHDIVGDIPRVRQSFVKKCYSNWFFTVFILLANFGTALTAVIIEQESDKEDKEVETGKLLQHMVVAIVYLSGIPASFMLWYWPTYKAVGSGAGSQYTMAKVGYAIGILFNVFCVIGVLGYGSCGLMWAFHVQANKHENAAIPGFVLMCLYIIQTIIFCFAFWKVRKYQKEDFGALQQVKSAMSAISGI